MTLKGFRTSQPLVMLVSAFDHTGCVSPSGMSALAHHVGSAGFTQFVVAGVVGELHYTDVVDREALVAATSEALKDYPETRIIVGVTTGGGVAEEAEGYLQLGADAVMLFHGSGPSAAEELFAACASLEAQDIPFLIDFDGRSLEASHIAQCAAFQSLLGVKYGSADLVGWNQMREILPSDLPLIFGGGDDQAPNFVGAWTFTSTVANVAPTLLRKLATDLELSVSSGRGEEGPKFEELRRWSALRSSRPGYAAAVVKQALSAIGISVGAVRAPGNRFQIEDTKELISIVHDLIGKSPSRQDKEFSQTQSNEGAAE